MCTSDDVGDVRQAIRPTLQACTHAQPQHRSVIRNACQPVRHSCEWSMRLSSMSEGQQLWFNRVDDVRCLPGRVFPDGGGTDNRTGDHCYCTIVSRGNCAAILNEIENQKVAGFGFTRFSLAPCTCGV